MDLSLNLTIRDKRLSREDRLLACNSFSMNLFQIAATGAAMIAGGSVKVIASPTLLLNQTTPLTHKRASEKNTEPVTQPPPSKVVVVGDGTVSQNKDQNNSIFIFSVMLIFQNTIYTNLLYFDAHFILHHRF